MGDLPIIKIKDGKGGHTVINKNDFDPSKHEVFDDAAATTPMAAENGRNPSGTYSEPTPTDIRYPNKDHTEFENNHGAFVNRSAAELREEQGLPDAPGGLAPDPDFVPASDSVTAAAASDAGTTADAEAGSPADAKAAKAKK